MITEQIPVTYSPVGDLMDVVARLLALTTSQVIAGVVNQLKGYVAALNVETINVKAFP